MIVLIPSYQQFFKLFEILPTAHMTNISVRNSKNVNFRIAFLDFISVTNILLEDNSNFNKNGSIFLYVRSTHEAHLDNITVKNTTGSVIYLHGIFKKNLSNISLFNVENLDEIAEAYQNQIKISHYFEEEKLLDSTRPKKTIIENIYLNVSY